MPLSKCGADGGRYQPYVAALAGDAAVRVNPRARILAYYLAIGESSTLPLFIQAIGGRWASILWRG